MDKPVEEWIRQLYFTGLEYDPQTKDYDWLLESIAEDLEDYRKEYGTLPRDANKFLDWVFNNSSKED
jgi:hypothetical protein